MVDTFLLSLIQALTEFLPVSSTAHLIVLPKLWDIPTAGRLTEVALHVGTLTVVMVYFRQDILSALCGLPKLFKGHITKGVERFLMVGVATLPVVLAGFLVHKYGGEKLRSFEIMGWSSIFFGALLLWVDGRSPSKKSLDAMTYGDAFVVGLLQVIALIPGASRLGATLIASRLLGYDRKSAAHFSFLLSIPVVLGASTLMILDASKTEASLMTHQMLLSVVLCFVMGYGVLTLLMRWLERHTFMIFGWYRLLFGAGVLYMVYG